MDWLNENEREREKERRNRIREKNFFVGFFVRLEII